MVPHFGPYTTIMRVLSSELRLAIYAMDQNPSLPFFSIVKKQKRILRQLRKEQYVCLFLKLDFNLFFLVNNDMNEMIFFNMKLDKYITYFYILLINVDVVYFVQSFVNGFRLLSFKNEYVLISYVCFSFSSFDLVEYKKIYYLFFSLV